MTVQEVAPPPAPAARAAALRALVERADRARAQAIANCRNLEQVLSPVRASANGFDIAHRSFVPAHAQARIRELEETVDGLMKRLESQGPIEQAKGIIVAQTHCTPDEAFEILRRASQRSNTKLRVLALDLVARTSRTEATPLVR